MFRRWGQPALLLALGALIGITRGSVLPFVLFAALALALSPLIYPRTVSAAEAQERSAQDGKAIIYWRPGCPFCLRLRATLTGRADQAYWVDIWTDPEGAAAVRAVANGNETVPTVILAGTPHVNPSPLWLRGALRAG
jgi:mycoredoxin